MNRLFITMLLGAAVFMGAGLKSAGAYAGMGANAHFYPGHMMGYGFMGWMMILFWCALLIVMVVVIRWVSRLSGKNQPGLRKQESPLDVLKIRLAKGEIEIAEYHEKKRLIEQA
jgi:putative membrane protein